MTAPPRHYLDFERPIAELESKVEELSRLSQDAAPGAFDDEIASLRRRIEEVRAELYANLDPWRRTQVARHPDRPHTIDYIAALIEDFVELRGDRAFMDDQAVIGGLGRFRGRGVVVMGHEKGSDTAGRIRHNFGMGRPEAYRKAVRLMDLADRFGLAVISFVDTAGAYPGKEGEERGIGEAIARATERGLTLGVPMIATIIGEGGSGGALGLAAANKVLVLENSYYSVITPEAGSSILFRDRNQAARMAAAMKITGEDLHRFGIVDRVVPEPVGGAHADRAGAIQAVGEAVGDELAALGNYGADELRRQRAERFYAIGRNLGA